MIRIKYLVIVFLFITSALAEPKKIYFYTTELNINDFKSLKVSFDKYLKAFGNYDFQAFNTRANLEKYLNQEDIIVILSSWHYMQISKKYDLNARFVALKKQSIMDTKILVGRKDVPFNGTVATAFSKQYSKELIDSFMDKNKLKSFIVPKEIDALMSVGFGLSKFALVSKDSFDLLKETNSFLARQIDILNESLPTFRMLVSSKLKEKYNEEFFKIFTNMNYTKEGKRVLDILGIEKMIVLTKNNLEQLRSVK